MFHPKSYTNLSKKLSLSPIDTNTSSRMTGNAMFKKQVIKLLALAIFIYCMASCNQGRRSLEYRISRHGAISPTTALLGIFSYSAGGKKRGYIRDTFIKDADEQFCPLNEYVRQQTRLVPRKRVCRFPYTFIIGGGSEDRPTDHHDDAPLAIDMETIENSETSDCNYYNKEGSIASDCTYLNIKEVRRIQTPVIL